MVNNEMVILIPRIVNNFVTNKNILKTFFFPF